MLTRNEVCTMTAALPHLTATRPSRVTMWTTASATSCGRSGAIESAMLGAERAVS
jgi:hypothetical protein